LPEVAQFELPTLWSQPDAMANWLWLNLFTELPMAERSKAPDRETEI